MYTCKIIMYTCKIIMYTCIDNYVYMQDNYVYIIIYIFFTQVKIYVVQWKTYVVMSLQGHRSYCCTVAIYGMLHVKQNTSNVMLVGEVGKFPPSVLCHRNTQIYLIRLNNMPQGSVLKSVFLESKILCELGHRSWYTKVWELAQSYNLDINS